MAVHSTGFRFPLLTITLVIVLASGLACAQGRATSNYDSIGESEIDETILDLIVEYIELRPDQREALVQLVVSHRERFAAAQREYDAAAEPWRAKIAAAPDFTLERHELKAESEKALAPLVDELQVLEASFFTQASALLDEEQVEVWPLAVRDWRRRQYLRFANFYLGEDVDIVAVARRAAVAEMEEISEALEAYSVRLDFALTEKMEWETHNDRHFDRYELSNMRVSDTGRAYNSPDPVESDRRSARRRQRARAMRDVNRESATLIMAILPGEAKSAFRLEYLTKLFQMRLGNLRPDPIYREKLKSDVLALDGLDEKQREFVEAEFLLHEDRVDAVLWNVLETHDRMVDARFESGKIGERPGLVEAAKQAVRDAFALENAFLVRVQAVLTQEQRERILPVPTLIVPEKVFEEFR